MLELKISIFLFLLILFYFIIRHFKFKYDQFVESEISVLIYTIDTITNTYKELIFKNNYEELVAKYDIDEKSKTKSLERFNEDYNQLIKDSAKDILENYLATKLKVKSKKYFTTDSLLLYLISSLRS